MKISPPLRVTRTYVQRLAAEPAICPVREADWIDGWDPVAVFTYSGVAEQDCVFVTARQPNNAVWFITRHEPENGFVEMLKFTPEETTSKLTIRLRAVQDGSEAEITYSHKKLPTHIPAWDLKAIPLLNPSLKSSTNSSCVPGKTV
jgi:hypothetical protein